MMKLSRLEWMAKYVPWAATVARATTGVLKELQYEDKDS